MTGSVIDRFREVRLRRHLEGELTTDHFEVVETEVPDAEVLVRTQLVHLAAAFKDLMKADCDLPMPPFEVGKRVGGGAIGTVVRSASPDLAVGDTVQSFTGWGEYSAGAAGQFHRVDPNLFPSNAYYLSQGPTAYYGMVDVAEVGPDDVVFVSGAAGGVGSLAGQIARCRGAKRVIGSAGSPAKVDYLVRELGYDAAFDYHDGPVVEQLRALAPEGISVFFDNVGGEQFEAAVEAAAPGARFALCGALSAQAGVDPRAGFPRLDVLAAITKRLSLLPFACYHLPEQIAAWGVHFGQWLAEGRFVYSHVVVDGGIDDTPAALVDLLEGRYTGNVTLRLG
jgi:NADPH-dependent curcumin reductase CurA